jgi:hypothetical protein
MPYTTHGHWYGPGDPTKPGPRLIAKCFGLGGCLECRTEAGLPSLPELPPKWSGMKTGAEDIHGLLRGMPRQRIPFEEATPETYGRLYDAKDALLAEVDRLAEQVKRVREVTEGLHQGSAHFPDECRRDCPGCAIDRALEGTEADRG